MADAGPTAQGSRKASNAAPFRSLLGPRRSRISLASPDGSTEVRSADAATFFSRPFQNIRKGKGAQAAGVEFQVTNEDSQRSMSGASRKSRDEDILSHYDPFTLLYAGGALRVLCSRASKATAVGRLTVATHVGTSFVIAIGVAVGMRYFYHGRMRSQVEALLPPNGTIASVVGDEMQSSSEDVGEMDGLLNSFNGFVAFLLALFVSKSVSRWWDLRLQYVGGVWGATDDLSLWAAAWWSSPRCADRAARALVARYGALSMALLFAEGRGELSEAPTPEQAGLTFLVEEKLLTEQEAVELAPRCSKPQIVWAWLTAFFTYAMFPEHNPGKRFPDERTEPTGPGGTFPTSCPDGKPYLTPVPGAAMIYGKVLKKCAAGRGAIGACLAHLETQQPFAYVHLLGLCIDAAIMLNAISTGLKLASLDHNLSNDDNRFFPHLGDSWPLVLASVLRLIFIPVITDGVLTVGCLLSNPFDGTPNSFPSEQFGMEMYSESCAYGDSIEAMMGNPANPWAYITGRAPSDVPLWHFWQSTFQPSFEGARQLARERMDGRARGQSMQANARARRMTRNSQAL